METKIGAKSMVLNEKTAVDHKENINASYNWDCKIGVFSMFFVVVNLALKLLNCCLDSDIPGGPLVLLL